MAYPVGIVVHVEDADEAHTLGQLIAIAQQEVIRQEAKVNRDIAKKLELRESVGAELGERALQLANMKDAATTLLRSLSKLP